MIDMRFRPIDVWPGGETRGRRSSPFRASYSTTLSLVQRELRHVRARDVVIMLALGERDILLDGSRPRADARPRHPGVILAFDSKHGPMKISADSFLHWHDNLRAIGMGLHDLRRLDRYGISRRGEQYTGWRALPDPSSREFSSAREAALYLVNVAGHNGGSPIMEAERILSNPEALRDTVRRAQKATHPDAGGDAVDFDLVTRARAMIEEHHCRKEAEVET